MNGNRRAWNDLLQRPVETMKKQLQIFLNAVMFFTRIPVPRNLPYSDEMLNRSTCYLPLVGWVVGGLGATVFCVAQRVFPPGLAILLSMLATILATGAFHEDGFADFCDAFGGGHSRERILAIMKDSRLGTYGSIGLVGMLATKFMSLSTVHVASVPLVMLAGHALSRLMPIVLINTSRYSREDTTSKSRAIAQKGRGFDFALAVLFGLAFLAFLPLHFVLAIVPVLLLMTFVFRSYVTKKIGGYTGDCLGALQQLAEVVFYLGYVLFQDLPV